MEKVGNLLSSLKVMLPKIKEGARIATILSQVMYAGASLG